MEIDWSKVISISAIVISIITIFVTRKNLKKQLRLGKLEEMLETLHFLNGYYNSILRAFVVLEDGIEDYKKGNINSEILKEAKQYREGLIKVVSMETILNKVSRLRILSNAYLKNSKKDDDLKLRIFAISDIYYLMYIFVYSEGHAVRKEQDAVIPEPEEMKTFIEKLEIDIIKEMNLGYKRIDSKSHDKYFEKQFKKDLGRE